MIGRFFFLLSICVFGACLTGAHAVPLAAKNAAAYAQSQSFAIKAGQGCGWDYPCPPVPDFNRRSFRREPQIYIHNNYGAVNVYPTHRRRGERGRPAERPCSTDGGCEIGRNCGGFPCDEECGALCWMRRFKQGYCGHGCSAYLEQKRQEDEERAEREYEDRRLERREERARRAEITGGCDRESCPPRRHERHWREVAPAWRDRPSPEAPPPGDLTPQGRFDGPHYRGTCANRPC